VRKACYLLYPLAKPGSPTPRLHFRTSCFSEIMPWAAASRDKKRCRLKSSPLGEM